MSKVECALQIEAILGEGPLWRPSEKKLYWLDLFAPAIHRFDPASGRDENLKAELGAAIGGMVFDRAGNWIVVDREGIHRIDPKQGKRRKLAAPPELKAGMTFNDAKCDRRGRLWTGTGDVDWVKPVGELYMLDGSGKLVSLDKPIACSNGPAFSPDGTRAYYTDGNARHVIVYDIDKSTGAVGGRRPFYTFPGETEGPDGMTVDADGCLWVALWGDGHVAQLTPKGKLERKLKVPVPQPTSVGFAGEGLGRMFITSARVGLGDQQLKDAPLSGSIFVADVGTKGLPEPDFAG
jgi:sugar lactone lactonase YvrE